MKIFNFQFPIFRRKFQKIKNIYHFFAAVLANIWYGFPGRKLKIIGVTGTDGKTTTTHLIYHILKTAGKKVSMVSSVYAKIGDQEYDIGFHVTTPSPFQIQKFLKMAADDGCNYFVLETTSHALDQYRVWGVNYEIGIVTNITNEHLDYHLDYEDYVKTKAKLLQKSKLAVINSDDRSYRLLIDQIPKTRYQKYDAKFKYSEKLPKLTEFNKYNYSAAYTACKSLDIKDETIVEAMKTFKLPKGRLEVVYDKDFKVVVDFAHTPNALENILSSLGKNIIHVFGSAGLRDHLKRSQMGKISGQYAKKIILTEEDYRTEDPVKICKQIASGISEKKYEIIVDRQEAIKKAISLAKSGDTVVITGKGHEKSLCRGKKEYPWNDQLAVFKVLNDKLR